MVDNIFLLINSTELGTKGSPGQLNCLLEWLSTT